MSLSGSFILFSIEISLLQVGCKKTSFIWKSFSGVLKQKKVVVMLNLRMSYNGFLSCWRNPQAAHALDCYFKDKSLKLQLLGNGI